ncbi:MAG TPA: XdhC family protein [Bacilli bacterium]|nr:XdhC family protein [Bacilli bacterium]
MDDIHRLLHILVTSQQKSVLATIIRVDGTAYRKAGAAMLFQADGQSHGLLSAGCMEADLAARAQRMMEDEKAFARGAGYVQTYDMSREDDLGWGQGAGCNGTVYVLLEAVNEAKRSQFAELKYHLERGMAVRMWKKFTPEGELDETLFETGTGERFGRTTGSQEIRSHLDYSHTFMPQPRLLLFGAGPDARPLAQLAAETGFAVTVADWRASYCTQRHFPHSQRHLFQDPKQAIKQLSLTPEDSVIIMTHNFQRDQEVLTLLLHHNLRYLGIMGPRRRTARLLGGADIPAHVHAPVGLPIGAEGPEQIAVSIVAELIQTVRTAMLQEEVQP